MEMKKMENDKICIDFGSLPFPKSYFQKETEIHMGGAEPEQCLGVNGTFYPFSQIKTVWEKDKAILDIKGEYKIAISYRLDGEALQGSISTLPGEKKVELLDFTQLALLEGRENDCYVRDTVSQKPWDLVSGKGLYDVRCEEGKIHDAIPENMGSRGIHACIYNGKICAFVRTDYAVEPLYTRFLPHTCHRGRSGCFRITLNQLPFRLAERTFSKWTFGIHVCADKNGDQNADACDYQLALRPYLAAPWYDYREALVYKIMCAMDGIVYTTFAQVMEIVAAIHRITRGRKQIVYLVGWQYDGHDSGYPSFDRVNEKLGTTEELREAIRVCKEAYHTTLSVHVNLDDSYKEHPGFDETVLSKDVDGQPIKWEVFGGKQSYHISHTKDVRQKKVFQRIDTLLELLPLEESIHFDAFRNTNYSWEEDEFIDGDKEWYLGMVPIVEYMRGKGLDVTTEGQNGMPVEVESLFSMLWHSVSDFPVLYHNLLTGGKGSTYSKQVFASDMDLDFTYSKLKNGEVARVVCQQGLLSKYLCGRNLINVMEKEGILTARYDDGTVARACDSMNYFCVETGQTVIAWQGMRFIPLGDKIFVWSDRDDTMERVLPKEYSGKKLTAEIVWGDKNRKVNYKIMEDKILMEVMQDTLIMIHDGWKDGGRHEY